MSRTRRTIEPVAGGAALWTVVDAWAETAVDPITVRARWSARAAPVRGIDHLVDVTGDAELAAEALRSAGVKRRPIRPTRRPLGCTGGLAYPDDPAVIDALASAGVTHRVVTRARRYMWRGPLTGPTTCEISTETDDGPMTVEAWHQPVWSDTFRTRPDADTDQRRRPRRVQQARAAINRLLASLGADPIPAGR